jgi:hypothetical protein
MVIHILHRQVALARDRDGRIAIYHQQIDLGAVLAGTDVADQTGGWASQGEDYPVRARPSCYYCLANCTDK